MVGGGGGGCGVIINLTPVEFELTGCTQTTLPERHTINKLVRLVSAGVVVVVCAGSTLRAAVLGRAERTKTRTTSGD